jgi:hypothetical protein
MELMDFLIMRIAEDEEWARAAIQHVGNVEYSSWSVSVDGNVVHARRGSPVAVGPWDGGIDGAQHIARWDPVRVLRECEAKQKLVDRTANAQLRALKAEEGQGRRLLTLRASTLEGALRVLALPYADHPDYVDEWRPQ